MRIRPNYTTIPLLISAVAGISGWLTSIGRQGSDWYEMLDLPTWAPTGATIGIVWVMIFVLAAISLLLIWNKLHHYTPRFEYIIQLFVLNALFNIGFSYLFFIRHSIFAALIDAWLLFATVVGIILLLHIYKDPQRREEGKYAQIAAMLLYPYAGWTLFASYLTYIIMTLN